MREEMIDVAHAHAVAEGSGDLETTLATLEPDPVYELQPAGRLLRGMDAVRSYYENFFTNFQPLVESYDLRSEWVTDEGVGQEYVIHLRLPDGSREHHGIIGILLFGKTRLAGERLWAGERLLRLMMGPVYDSTSLL
ncbi:MAG: hypothetical protein ACLQU2_21805 [Candidatus Binataceae bacterium]